MRISDWSSDVCSSDLAAAVALRPAERLIVFTARWKLAIAAPLLAMQEHGAGDSPLGFRGTPCRTQTHVCISVPFLSFHPSGPVLRVSHSETIYPVCSYVKRRPVGHESGREKGST